MATVGHLAAGFAFSRLAAAQPPMTDVAVITIAAAIPDVDFLLPIDHRGITHSLGAADAVGIVVAIGYRLLGRRAAWSIGSLSALAVLSHVALDLLTAEAAMPALWPLTTAEYVLPTSPLPSASPDASLLTVDGALLAIAELTWSAIVVVVASLGARRLHRRRSTRQ